MPDDLALKPIIAATPEHPGTWFAVGPGLMKAGPFNEMECADLVRFNLASYHRSGANYQIPQWVMDACVHYLIYQEPPPPPTPPPPGPFDIKAPPSASLETVRTNLVAKNVQPLFLNEMFAPLWDSAVRHGVNPVGVVAQSYKETKGGEYPGNVRTWFNNTAGIKVRNPDEVRRIVAAERFAIHPTQVNTAQLNSVSPDHPLCHQQNPSWIAGAEIQVLHLLEWCGTPAAWSENLDPRAIAVRQLLATKGPAVTWNDLGTRWAPSATYGDEIVTLMGELSA